jgi:hypothetical protein
MEKRGIGINFEGGQSPLRAVTPTQKKKFTVVAQLPYLSEQTDDDM